MANDALSKFLYVIGLVVIALLNLTSFDDLRLVYLICYLVIGLAVLNREFLFTAFIALNTIIVTQRFLVHYNLWFLLLTIIFALILMIKIVIPKPKRVPKPIVYEAETETKSVTKKAKKTRATPARKTKRKAKRKKRR